jgi:hypothetical protein
VSDDNYERIAMDLWNALRKGHVVIAHVIENGQINVEDLEAYYWWMREALEGIGCGNEVPADLIEMELSEILGDPETPAPDEAKTEAPVQ